MCGKSLRNVLNPVRALNPLKHTKDILQHTKDTSGIGMLARKRRKGGGGADKIKPASNINTPASY